MARTGRGWDAKPPDPRRAADRRRGRPGSTSETPPDGDSDPFADPFEGAGAPDADPALRRPPAETRRRSLPWSATPPGSTARESSDGAGPPPGSAARESRGGAGETGKGEA